MRKKTIFSLLVIFILFSIITESPAQFLRWGWWRQNPALSLIGFNSTLNPDRTGSGSIIAEGIFTPGLGFRGLEASNLTGEKGVLISASDNIRYSDGSLQGGDGSGVVVENFNPNQGSVEFWIRPNWNGDDGETYFLLDYIYTTNNRFRLRKVFTAGANYLRFYLGGSVTDVCFAEINVNTITAGNWYHIVAVWDRNETIDGTNYIKLYLNETTTGTQTVQPGDVASVGATLFIGQSNINTATFNGVIAGRILNRPLTSGEVTTLYASGAGHTDTFTVTPDTVWMGVYSDVDTDAIYWHRGQQVTDISDGATESTLTLGEAVGSRGWNDNDRVVVWDGTGYKKEGRIDGTPSGSSMDVDDGAGAVISGLSNVGRSLDFNATYTAQAANTTVHQITTEDLGLSAWIRADTAGAGVDYILKKYTTSAGYQLYLNSGIITLDIGDGTDTYKLAGNTDLRDNKWRQIAAVVDKSNAANCKIYIDGYEDGTTNKTGVLGDVGSITNADVLDISDSNSFDGQIRDVFIAYPADITAAGEMGAAGKIIALATNPRDSSQVNFEDYWACTDDAASTVVVGSFASLTASANTNTFATLECLVSKNLIADAGMENGGIGAWTLNDYTLYDVFKTTNAKFDTSAMLVNNTLAGAKEVRQTITVAAGENYMFNAWYYEDTNEQTFIAVYDISNAALISRTPSADYTDYTFNEIIFQIPAACSSIYIYLRPASSGQNDNHYVDQLQLLPSLVADGGMEGTLTDNWTQEASATMAADTSEHSGAQEMKITAGAANVGAYQAVTLVTGTYYTVSGWARATAGDSATIIMDTGDTATITVGTVTATSYTRISRTFKATGTSGVVYVRAVVNTDVVWFDDVAIVQVDKVSPSVLVPSSQANSYETGKWSDGDGAFGVDGLDTLTYPNTNISADRGAIAFWAKIQTPYTTPADRVLCDIRGADNNNRIKLFYQASDDRFTVYVNGANRIQTSAQIDNTNFYSWHHFVFSYDFIADRYTLCMDGSLIDSVRTALTSPVFGANNIYIGSNYDGSAQGDVFFDDLFFFKKEITLNDVRKLYALPGSAHFRSLAGGW